MQNNYLSFLSLCLVLIIDISSSFAQCTVGFHDSMAEEGLIQVEVETGQSFIASCDGQLTFVQLFAHNDGLLSAGVFKLYAGNTTEGSPLYTQNYEETAFFAGGPISIPITAEIELTEGNQYTFVFTLNAGVNLQVMYSDLYPGGNLHQFNISWTTGDAIFEVGIDTVFCTTAYKVEDITACSTSYSPPFSENIYTMSGIYFDTLQTSLGCDSIIQTNLSLEAVNTEITDNGEGVLSIEETLGASYSWIRACDSSTPTVLAQENSFTLDVNNYESAYYAAIVQNDFCIDTSACIEVMIQPNAVSEAEQDLFSLFPNPTSSGAINLVFDKKHDEVLIDVFDISTKPLSSQKYQNVSSISNLIISKTPGSYFLRIVIGKKTIHKKIVQVL